MRQAVDRPAMALGCALRNLPFPANKSAAPEAALPLLGRPVRGDGSNPVALPPPGDPDRNLPHAAPGPALSEALGSRRCM
jgi:hypothetical protein